METLGVYQGTRNRAKDARAQLSPSETEERSEGADQSSGRDDQPGLTRDVAYPFPRTPAVTERMPGMFGLGSRPVNTKGVAGVSRGVERSVGDNIISSKSELRTSQKFTGRVV